MAIVCPDLLTGLDALLDDVEDQVNAGARAIPGGICTKGVGPSRSDQSLIFSREGEQAVGSIEDGNKRVILGVDGVTELIEEREVVRAVCRTREVHAEGLLVEVAEKFINGFALDVGSQQVPDEFLHLFFRRWQSEAEFLLEFFKEPAMFVDGMAVVVAGASVVEDVVPDVVFFVELLVDVLIQRVVQVLFLVDEIVLEVADAVFIEVFAVPVLVLFVKFVPGVNVMVMAFNVLHPVVVVDDAVSVEVGAELGHPVLEVEEEGVPPVNAVDVLITPRASNGPFNFQAAAAVTATAAATAAAAATTAATATSSGPELGQCGRSCIVFSAVVCFRAAWRCLVAIAVAIVAINVVVVRAVMVCVIVDVSPTRASN